MAANILNIDAAINIGIKTNVVEVYVRYLRNKIDAPGQPSYIKTVRGTGYMVRDDNAQPLDLLVNRSYFAIN